MSFSFLCSSLTSPLASNPALINLADISAKFIKAGFDARGEVKEEQRKEKLKQEDEDILDELKRKDLSEEDLKDLYDKIQNKKKDDNE